MTAARTVRLNITQPFEFHEARLSPAERSRLAKATTFCHLFDQEPQRLEIKEFDIRSISIRMRTINNASDSGASLPDGTPLTEVSIYSSRDCRFVLGPYVAVQRLMSGVVPDHRPYDTVTSSNGSDALTHLDSALCALANYIGQVEKGGRVQRVYLDSLLPRGPVASQFGRMVQVAKEDLDFLQQAFSHLEALKLVIPKAPESPDPPDSWWKEMPQFVARDEYKRLTDDIMCKAREVLCKLEDHVFTPG